MTRAEVSSRVPVFLGSTYEDLSEHRTAVLEVLNRFEAVVKGMELFGSRPGTPKAECLAAVRDSKVYIGLFAMRYGSCDPETGLSLTHLELLEAERLALPVLIYLIDEKRHPVLPVFVDTGDAAEALRNLKAHLRERYTLSFFTSPADLARRVSQDLPSVLVDAGAPVEPSELRRVVETIPRISWLSGPRFDFLKSKLGPLAETFPSEAVLRDCIELLILGDRLSAAYLIAKSDAELTEADRLRMEIDRFKVTAESPSRFDSRVTDMSSGLRGAIDLCMSLESELEQVVRKLRDEEGAA